MKSRAFLVIVALLLLVCLIALVVGLLLARTRMAEAAEQPMVLINAPSNGAQVWMDRAAPVLVTARSRNTIARVELWANGRLQENRAVPQEGLTTLAQLLCGSLNGPAPTLSSPALSTPTATPDRLR